MRQRTDPPPAACAPPEVEQVTAGFRRGPTPARDPMLNDARPRAPAKKDSFSPPITRERTFHHSGTDVRPPGRPRFHSSVDGVPVAHGWSRCAATQRPTSTDALGL